MLRLLFYLLCLPLFATSIVKERLSQAESGDYLVLSSRKMVTLIRIQDLLPHSIIFEEITAPEAKLSAGSWPNWVQSLAPGHTSWSMIEIERHTGEILECYSFSKAAWLQISPQESLLATLFQLPLQEIPEADRRRIGPAPLAGERDQRKIWQPPALYEGKKEALHFDAYQALWPKDGSELAGQTLLLYFDQELRFPFPFWIQVETAHLNLSLRAIDAGKGLHSPHKHLPRRIPQFVGQPQKVPQGMRLRLQAPKYYQSFELYAIDVTAREKEIASIDHQLLAREGELVTLQIPEEALESVLKPGHRYNWLVVPRGFSDSYTQSTQVFIWGGNDRDCL